MSEETAPRELVAAIFDVDGVLVASPHERAWREALAGFADPASFTTEFYQAKVAGKPRLAGARATLEGLGVVDAAARVRSYAAKKQALIDRLIAAGEFEAFPDAVRLAVALRAAGLRLALASSSKNVAAMLSQLNVPGGNSLLSIFDADLSGTDVPRGKPDPALFLLAAKALDVPPEQCLVVEDAPAGIKAARAGGMAALGIARLDDEALLGAAGADLVVTSLDQVDVAAIRDGTLRINNASSASAMHELLQPTPDSRWTLRHEGYSVLSESAVESRFALSNGFLGMRAARAISRGSTWLSWLSYVKWASWPRCYVAGLFDRPNTEPAVPALVPVADWSRMRIVLDGKPQLLSTGAIVESARILDLKRGLLLSELSHRTASGIVVSGTELRLVSMADRAVGLQLLRFLLDRDGVDVRLEANFAMAGLGMEPARLECDLGAWSTEVTGKGIAMAGYAALRVGGVPVVAERPFPLRWVWRWHSVAGQAIEFDRIIAVARADSPDDDPSPLAEKALSRSRSLGWRAVLAEHEAAWGARWRAGDVVIDGDDELQQALRFAVYHLTGAADPDDERVSVGARGLTGDAYFGHVFWDTEIYLLPFYTAVWPEAARALLMYRFHTLPAARAKAVSIGCRGALYAWESADTGEETTPDQVVGPDGALVDVLTGRFEQHISADIAYAVWQYWQITGDDEFFLMAGAEILLETARFWSSRAVAEADGRRHIRHVIGPDEYHEDVDDNAFTNVMARWNIERALEAIALLRQRWPDRAADLCDKLALGDAELDDWRDAVARIVTGLDAATGIYEEFAGFNKLEPLDLSLYADRKVAIDVLLGRERTRRSQVVKQADVVALLALLPEEFPGAMAAANFRHYERRTAHGSSLSAGLHALVAARLGDLDTALRFLRQAARADLDFDPVSAGGIRIGGLGSVWQTVVLGFAGLGLRHEGISINPRLPDHWRCLAFAVRWRGRPVQVSIAGTAVRVAISDGEAVDVSIAGRIYSLKGGVPLEVRIEPTAAVLS
jgi:trehalose/maltose hydrolase-like predicted phosphorylase/beta-phosphoglucomutase-like phosphatase (HAD superfamily)